MRRSEESIDLMIFDYLEGNMTMEEQLDFEANAAVDALLKEELEIWQSTYIASEIPDTGVLENSLIHKPSPFASFTFYLNTILIVAVSFISNTQIEREFDVVHGLEIPSIELVKKSPNYGAELEGMLISVMHKVVSKPVALSEEFEDLSLMRKSEPLSSLHMQLVNFEEYLLNPMLEVEISKIKNSDIPEEQKKTDRKHFRYINRMRNKAARQRRAYEFMKGDVPYVVPIDTRNF